MQLRTIPAVEIRDPVASREGADSPPSQLRWNQLKSQSAPQTIAGHASGYARLAHRAVSHGALRTRMGSSRSGSTAYSGVVSESIDS
jgi:hypothetical protein